MADSKTLIDDRKDAIAMSDGERERFEVELEFVQSLANPYYLNFLAQHGYFKDKSFVNYLRYLQYWKHPKYARFLKYPHCLHFLDLLQHKEFQKELVNAQCAKFIEEQILLQWQYNRHKRLESQHQPPSFKQAGATSGDQSASVSEGAAARKLSP
ncbi:mediator of RNA polymerase II transcription subunit 31-like isoform X2 [Corticium candelabrum]|uniref:mediator of RNA polymerase II transcription subunit 31-like isoform X2 n=1 Tax=Corticium candelabrum TaxID=121492 RepID=UPI002E25C6EA|nr:mediator of RNA polymerase II transcription subunit 31-like isoform X2 [Corticium candelabrum]